MKGRLYSPGLLCLLCFLTLTGRSVAQSITTGPFSPTSVCPGSQLAVSFTTTGSFSATNTFSVQLSDPTGTFLASPAVIGTGNNAARTINATIPLSASAGTAYRVRVISSTPARLGSISPQPLIITAPPAEPLADALLLCVGQSPTSLTATAVTGATLNWYTAASGGTPLAAAPVPSVTAAGTTNYYVSQTVNGCESPRATLPVTVRNRPDAPSVRSLTACVGQPPGSLSATAATGGTLNWYTAASGGTPSTVAPTPSTTAVGSATYYVSQTVNGCESGRASLLVAVNAVPQPPTATPPAPYCEGTTATSLSAVGQGLTWYGTSATGSTGSSVAPPPSTTVAGTTNYYVSQSVNGCESSRTPIPVVVKDAPDAPGTAPIEFCQGTPAPPLTVSLAAGATVSWYGTNATGGMASPTPPTPATANVGTTTYYVSQTVDGCASPRAGLPVRIKPVPGAPAVSPISLCANSPAQPLTAQGNAGSTIRWFDASDNPLAGTPTPNTSQVGTQSFKATQTSGEGCESREKAVLTVTIKPLPNAPAVSNLSYCQSQRDQPTQNVSALTAGGQNLRWYNPDGNAFPNAPTPSLDRSGTQTYQVSQTVDGCEGARATLQVVVNTTAAPTVARSLYTYCINDQATPLQATAEPGASLRWVDPFERQTTEAPTPSTLNANVNLDGDPFYVYQIGANGCYSPRATIRVRVNTTPSLALLAPTINVNLGQTVPLQLKFTGSGPYSYTITGGYSGTARQSDTTITVLPRGNTTYQVNAVSNGCGRGLPGNPATAVVTVRVPTVVTDALTTSTLCAGQSLVVPFTTTGQFNSGNAFGLELASVADTARKYSVPATAGGSPVTATLPVTLPGGPYYVRANASNPGIGIVGSNSPTVLTVRARPTATLAGTQAINEGVPANLTITLGGDAPWTLTYADSVRSYSAVTSTSPYVAEVRPARRTTYRITTVSNTCGTGVVSGTATVSVLTLLSTQDDSLDPLVKIYPTPTSTMLTIDLIGGLTRAPAVFQLTDLRGRPVWQLTTRSHRTDLDLSTYPSGPYLLRIRVGDRQTVRRVLKQ